jgi:hypothetical protein
VPINVEGEELDTLNININRLHVIWSNGCQMFLIDVKPHLGTGRAPHSD